MIKKATKVSAIALFAGLTTGCATNSDIEGLQSQIDDVKTQTASASADARRAMDAANAANAKAASAESAALRAAAAAEETNSKLDAMFRKSMMK